MSQQCHTTLEVSKNTFNFWTYYTVVTTVWGSAPGGKPYFE